tara:strand:- start:2411 stop:3055 length:645 start_codon:yes stop_codon:yes gene_type:complete
MPITFLLGLWQVDRANQKTDIIKSYEAIINDPAVEFKIENNYINWQPVYLEGEFTDIVLYEDNALLNGKAGFKIYHLFKTLDDLYIFIHRGFIERKVIKNDLPIIDVPEGKKILNGTILLKNQNSFVQNVNESDLRIIQQFSIIDVLERIPFLQEKIIYPDLFNLSRYDQSKLMSIERPVNMTASKHIGYAIQWFGLCLALLILTIYAYRRKDE